MHLATHATFSPGSVNQSYIQFWDQQLRLDQLKQLNLQVPVVQLLVLSACRTALGDPQAELGFAGLAVQSGAKAAIASLWSVSSRVRGMVASSRPNLAQHVTPVTLTRDGYAHRWSPAARRSRPTGRR